MKQDYIIFDNYDGDYLIDETLESLHCNGHEDATRDEVLTKYEDWYCDEDAMQWNYMLQEVDKFFPSGYGTMVLCCGFVGRWNGTGRGGKLFEHSSFQEVLWDLATDCDYFRIGISKDSRTLFCDCTHHDGSNHFEFRQLTDAGYNAVMGKYYGEYGCPLTFDGLTDEEVHDRLWNSYYYSRPIVPDWLKTKRRIRSVPQMECATVTQHSNVVQQQLQVV